MPGKGWWDRHRLLRLGSRGNDVRKLQNALNGAVTPRIPVNGVFDQATVLNVREFQKLNRLVEDGIAGPFTQSALFETNYSYSLRRPPFVRQDRFLCWAAALESITRSTWRNGRGTHSVPQLINRYRKFVQPRGDITWIGLNQVFRDLIVVGNRYQASNLRVETIVKFMYQKQKQIILIDYLGGPSIAHARVIYGVVVKEGVPQLLVMDPLRGFLTLDFVSIQDSKTTITLGVPAL